MANKNFIVNSVIGSQTAVTSTLTSSTVSVYTLDNLGIQVVWSNGASTPAGTIAVQASIDGKNFTALTLSSTPAISGNSGNLLISINQFPYSYMKVVVTMSAGQADLVINYSGTCI